MPDEVLQQVAEVTAPEQVATAEPVSEVSTTPEEKPAEPPKTFTQEELDAAISKRLAREQRKWERTQAAKQPEPPKAPVEPPVADQFTTPEAYAEALAQQKAEELVAKREFEQQRREVMEAYHEREEEARGKYDDFEQVAYNPTVRITAVMAEVIQSSEIGPDLAYHLGSNPKEAERISKLTPFLQAKEIGRLEDRLLQAPPTKKVTTAPPPISPVAARGSGNPSYDTTDPRSIKTMTTSEWIEADRLRQLKKLEAQRHR